MTLADEVAEAWNECCMTLDIALSSRKRRDFEAHKVAILKYGEACRKAGMEERSSPTRWSLRQVDGPGDEPLYDGMETDKNGDWVRFDAR